MSTRLTSRVLAVGGLLALTTVAGCSSSSPEHVASSSSTETQLTISGTPQSKWPTSAPPPQSTSTPPAGGAPTAMPEAGKRAKQFVTDFLHTDGVTQEEWAKQVAKTATRSFGDRLSSEGLERLPHGAKVTGDAQQLWISEQDPTGMWFVPTSNGGYTVTMDLNNPPGSVADMTPGKDEGNMPATTNPDD